MTTARPSPLALIAGDVACIRSRDPAARSTLEIVLVYPGLHAVMAHRLAAPLWRRGWRTLARLMSFAARVVTGVDIHPGAAIGRRFFIDHGAGVVIGETAVIGDDVTLYHGVTLGGTSWSPGRRHPTLGDRVLVGAGAKILGPITVESGSRIGANSVVIEDVPANATVVGIPGRVVRAAAERRMLEGGRIDLQHHEMPDPVGEALSYLVDRVNFLEVRLAEVRADQRGRRSPADPAACPVDTDHGRATH